MNRVLIRIKRVKVQRETSVFYTTNTDNRTYITNCRVNFIFSHINQVSPPIKVAKLLLRVKFIRLLLVFPTSIASVWMGDRGGLSACKAARLTQLRSPLSRSATQNQTLMTELPGLVRKSHVMRQDRQIIIDNELYSFTFFLKFSLLT